MDGFPIISDIYHGSLLSMDNTFFLRFSVDKFVASGLMRKEYDRVKLHLNLFKKEQGDLGDKDLGQARESFD
jgi:hypothetical protein